VIESTEFSEKAACLILFVKSNRRLFYFICQSGYSQSDPDSAYAALNRSF